MEELRLKLIKDCNESGLTVEELMFVVKDVYRDVTDLYTQWLRQRKNAETDAENSEPEPAQNKGE